MPLTQFSARDFKPFWSKQHGAYITLITSWLIAVIVSQRIIWLQIIVLFFIMSGLNFTELLAEKIKRKSPLPKSKLLWLFIYALIVIITGTIILFNHPDIVFYLPWFITGVVLFTVLSYKKMHKSILSEWIIFSMFALAGLTAYLPAIEAQSGYVLKLLLLMAIYYGITIFTVKARLKKIPNFVALLYAIISSAFLIVCYGTGLVILGVSALVLIKSLQVILMRGKYEKLKLRSIGMIETGFHLIFVLIFLVETKQ
jgi:hypothetical protein